MTAPADIPHPNRFAGRTVLVTGAASGIGATCVHRLLSEGASIAAADMDADAIRELAAQAGAAERVLAASVDVSNADQVQTACVPSF